MIASLFSKNKVLIFSMIIAAFFSLFMIGAKSFWVDEVLSAYMPLKWDRMLWILHNNEANMWAYMVLMHFWLKLGTNEGIIRSLSALFAIVSVPAIYILAKELFDKRVASLSSFLLSINFFFIFKAQLARSYSMLLFVTILCSYFYVKSIKANKKIYWIGFIIFSALSIYTHLFGGLFVLATYLSFFYQGRRLPFKQILISGISSFILLIPLFIAPAQHGSAYDWYSPPKITSLIAVLILLSGDNPVTLFLFASVFVAWICGLLKMQKKINITKISWKYLYLVTLLVVPPLIAFLFSAFVKPIYQSTYFQMLLSPFLILVAKSLSDLRTKKLFILLIIIIILLSMVRLIAWYGKSKQIAWVIENENQNWKDATKLIVNNSKSTDGIIFYDYFEKLSYQWYLGKNYMGVKNSPQIIEVASRTYSPFGGDLVPDPDPKKFVNLERSYSRIWYVVTRKRGNYLQIKNYLETQYNLVSQSEFKKINIFLFN